MSKHFYPDKSELLTGTNLIEASAGTGKTYAIAMLVLRFVVEQNLDIKNILVVTFTKAATEELKNRIRTGLALARNIISGHDRTDDNIQQWLNSLNISTELIQQRLTGALLDIDQAGIFTIHGFCQRILTEHALESRQLFDSELTGDISAIKQACSDDFWRKQIYQRSAWEAALLTSNYKTPDQLLASVETVSSDLTIFPEYEDLELSIEQLKQLALSCTTKIDSSLLAIKEKIPEGKFKPAFENNFADQVDVLKGWLSQNQAALPEFSNFTQQGLIKALNGHKFRKSKANPFSSEEQKRAYIEAIDYDAEVFDQIDAAVNQIGLMFRRSLLETLKIDLDQRLEQLNTLSFDHLISRLANALAINNSQALTKEIRLRYKVALIDEFQDTDQYQWNIFSTLFNHNSHYLFLIGDPKQAIYKFRGADIYSYFSAQQQAQHQFTLSKNWRSHPQLVAAVNTLFARGNPFFSDHLQFTPANAALSSDHGIITKSNLQIPPCVLWQLDKSENEYWSSGKATDEIVIAVINEIQDLLNGDYHIQSAINDAEVQAKDIAILVSSNAQAKIFQLTLNEVGITSVINSKESVFGSKSASDLYKLLQAIAQPADHNLLKQALMLSGFNLNGQQFYQTLNDERLMDQWISRFQNYHLLWAKHGLMSMMQKLLATENFQSHLSLNKLAERNITNLHHCIELVQQAVIDEHLGINKTLDWLHQQIVNNGKEKTTAEQQQLRLESDEDAVKIITMHSSKGLEFPVVFCPFLWQRGIRVKQQTDMIKCHDNNEMIVDLGSEQFEYHRSLALDEELAEDLRIAYVAITRAKYRCYINWADVRSKEKSNDSALAYLLEFSTERFDQQQDRLQHYSVHHPSAFAYRLISSEQEFTVPRQSRKFKQQLNYLQKQRSLYTNWQMSSYTALSSLSINDTPELPYDKVREDNIPDSIDQDIVELPKGPHTGNVIHDLLENIPFSTLAGNIDISLLRDKSCLRYGVQTQFPEQIDQLLKNTVCTLLTSDTASFKLSHLDESQCLKEMPFYLSMKTMDVSQINSILQDSIAFQPLTEKKLCGYLTGFIDLLCEHQGKYYLIDYKSNSLDNYDHENLITAMREHNYGLQYWIYSLVIHLYLQQRVLDYHYETHFGGVMYLFVRGMDGQTENSGVFQTKPKLDTINQLVKLFVG